VTLASDPAAPAVVLCDMDLQFGTSAQLLGITPDRDVADLIRGLAAPGPLDAYLIREPVSGLHVLPAPRELELAETVMPEDLSRVVMRLRQRFDHVVLDLPSQLDFMTLSLLDLSSRMYLLTEPVLPTMDRTLQLMTLLAQQGFGSDRIQVVLNRRAGFESSPLASTEALLPGMPIAHVLPHERHVLEAAEGGQAFVHVRPKSEYAQAVAGIARELAERLHLETGAA
jgi:pilus assembly protein CpaE